MTSPDTAPSCRVDKWLWHARFFKARSQATEMVAGGHLRINGRRVVKPAQPVRVGDTLTLVRGSVIRVVRVRALAERRGLASEAQGLYEDLEGPARPAAGLPAPTGGRPDRKERRAARHSKQHPLE